VEFGPAVPLGRPLLVGRDKLGVGGTEVEVALPLTIAGLAYKVSNTSVKLAWRLTNLITLLIRPPQISDGLPGQGCLQEP